LQSHNRRFDAVGFKQLFEQDRMACPLGPKPKIFANADMLSLELCENNFFDKFLGSESGEGAIERQNHQLVYPGLLKQRRPLLKGRQQWQTLPTKEGPRMGRKTDDRGIEPQHSGLSGGQHGLNHLTVPQMDAVEVPESNGIGGQDCQ
jgi:hypothetical protein